MKIIKLKTDEKEFINEHCNGGTLLNILNCAHFEPESSSFVLMINENEMKLICDELSDLLVDIGVSDEGEINSVGKMIDDLIDKFNHYK